MQNGESMVFVISLYSSTAEFVDDVNNVVVVKKIKRTGKKRWNETPCFGGIDNFTTYGEYVEP